MVGIYVSLRNFVGKGISEGIIAHKTSCPVEEYVKVLLFSIKQFRLSNDNTQKSLMGIYKPYTLQQNICQTTFDHILYSKIFAKLHLAIFVHAGAIKNCIVIKFNYISTQTRIYFIHRNVFIPPLKKTPFLFVFISLAFLNSISSLCCLCSCLFFSLFFSSISCFSVCLGGCSFINS